MTNIPHALLDDATPPSDDPLRATPCLSPAAHRGVALGFAVLSLVAVFFTTWWANQLATTHILSLHGCACARLSRENFLTFTALPALSLLIFHGARRAAVTAGIVVAGVGVLGSFAAYGWLAAIYFGYQYAHGA